MEEKKYLLPKKFLSWSAINCWMTNPERFRREYFENGEKLDLKQWQFGRGIAKLIEEGKHKELLPDLIVYDKPEHELKCEIYGVPMIGYIDSYDSEKNVFREYKTGKVPWTYAKVQKHDQLTLYATMLKHITGKMPEYCHLDWIETKDGFTESVDFWRGAAKEIQVTGRIVTFEREFDSREVDRMEFLILKCAEEISDAYKQFIAEI